MNIRNAFATINGQCWAVEESGVPMVVALAERMAGGRSTTNAPAGYLTHGSIAVIPITGLIVPNASWWGGNETALSDVRRMFRAALTADAVSAIVFAIDSPGGSAMGVDELSAEIFQARGRKPIVSVTEALCASAAYYLGSAADEVFGTPTSLSGSIGVITVHVELSDSLKAQGITPTVFTYGDRKADGNQFERLKPESRAAIQRRIDDYGELFVNAVARNRNVTAAKVRDQFGGGAVFLGAEARRRGLIDGVASLEKVLAKLPNRGGAAMSAAASNVHASTFAAVASAAPMMAAGVGGSAFIPPAVPSAEQVAAQQAQLRAAREREIQEARDEADAKSRDAALEKYKLFSGISKIIGATSEELMAALNANMTQEQFLSMITARRAKEERPIVRVSIEESGKSRFETDALLALQLKAGHTPRAGNVTEDIRRMSTKPMVQFAAECLQMTGGGRRFDQFTSPTDICAAAMQQGGIERVVIGATDGGPYNRPGMFPHLLSSLAGKILDDAIELSEATFDQWTGEWPEEIPDFKPRHVVNKSQVDELDIVLDGDAYPEFIVHEELLSWIQLARYGNKIGLTPVMMANDTLGAFREELLGFGNAVQNTTNRLCLNLLVGNGSLLDGGVFFDLSRGNVITPGAAPSVAAWDLMKQRVSAQRGVGGKGYVRTPLAVALIPPALLLRGLQTFGEFREIGEEKQAQTDDALNPFRGTVRLVEEPDLQDFSNSRWYGFVDPKRRAAIVRAYFTGFGRSGKRERWYDPNTGCWWYSVEHRVGVAAKNYRYAVLNQFTE